MDYIKIVKYTNCIGPKNQSGKGITKYAGVISTKISPNGYPQNTFRWITKNEALSSGLPMEIDSMEMQL